MSEDVFVYDEINRNHTLNGIPIPSVTKIMQPLSDYSRVPKDNLDNACNFGTAVHWAVELWLLGTLNEDTLDEGLKKPLEGFKQWFYTHSEILGFTPICWRGEILIEKPRFNKKLWYCGKPDLVFVEAVIEIKTRPYNRFTDPVQLAGQKGLFPEFPHKKPFVLEIDVEGNYKLVNAESKHAWGIFRKMNEFNRKQKEFNELLEKWKES